MLKGLVCVNQKYERDTTYRERYISAHPPKNGKYRCVYCGKKIPKDKMEVDHVVAVDRVKKNWLYRLCVPNGVNDLSNLVCSCHRCNSVKKKNKGGLWIVRGHFWKIILPIYMAIKYLLILALIVLISLFVLGFFDIGPAPELWQNVASWMKDTAAAAGHGLANLGSDVLGLIAEKIRGVFSR